MLCVCLRSYATDAAYDVINVRAKARVPRARGKEDFTRFEARRKFTLARAFHAIFCKPLILVRPWRSMFTYSLNILINYTKCD